MNHLVDLVLLEYQECKYFVMERFLVAVIRTPESVKKKKKMWVDVGWVYGNLAVVLCVRLEGLNTTSLLKKRKRKEKEKRKKVQRKIVELNTSVLSGAELISGPENSKQKPEMNKTSKISLKWYDYYCSHIQLNRPLIPYDSSNTMFLW